MNSPTTSRPTSLRASAERMALFVMLAVAAACLLSGCSAPVIYAKVIQGDASFITLVDESDTRLEQPGLADTSLRFFSNPDSLGRRRLGQVVTDESGWATMRVDLPAAGLARYDIEIIARRQGYIHARGTFVLPSSGRRVLISLKPGQDSYREQEDLQAEFERHR
jgi:hypothetical protein